MKKLLFYPLSIFVFLSLSVNAQSGFQQNGSSLYYNNGNIGIGTSTPTQKLSIKGKMAISTPGLVSDEGYNGELMLTKPAASGQFINLTRSSNFVWSIGMVYNTNTFAIGNAYTDDSGFTNPYFSIATNGNVGIRKANPEYTLDVNGTLFANNIRFDGLIRKDNYPFSYNNVPFEHFSLGWVNDPNVTSENGYALWLSGYGGMKFFTVGQPRLTITTPGNVGIGTTTPDKLLTVNGAIRAKEVIIESNWADFVFDDSYNLPSLDFVAKYIREKKHLPGIPSESQVKAKGVNLGEVNALLLQKIEEQTLYIIELHEEMKDLKKRIDDLEK